MDFDRIKSIIDKERSVRYWDFRYEDVLKNNLAFSGKSLSSVEMDAEVMYSIRVLFGNEWGFVSSDNPAKLEDNIRKAIRIARLMNKLSKRKVNLIQHKQIIDNVEFKSRKTDVPVEEKISFIKDGIKNSLLHNMTMDVRYFDQTVQKIFMNSEQSLIKQKFYYTTAEMTVLAGKGEVEDYSKTVGGFGGFEKLDNFESSAKEACIKVQKLLHAREARTGKCNVLLDNNLTSVFAHETVGHAAEADSVLEKNSYLTKGLDIRNPITIYDDSTENGFGSYFYDDEGVIGQRTDILHQGVVAGYLHTRETAALMNAALTGNARAEGADSVPMPRISNISIEAGQHSEQELLEEIKEGLVLEGSVGGETDTHDGNFEFPARIGYVVKKGEVQEMVKNITLSGNAIEALRSIAAIGKQRQPHAMYCQRGGQLIPTNGRNPKIVIRNMQVTGSR